MGDTAGKLPDSLDPLGPTQRLLGHQAMADLLFQLGGARLHELVQPLLVVARDHVGGAARDCHLDRGVQLALGKRLQQTASTDSRKAWSRRPAPKWYLRRRR